MNIGEEFDPRPKWVINDELRDKKLMESLPIKDWFVIFNSIVTGSELLISADEKTRFVLIAGCDITGNKKIIKSKKPCLVIFINNKSEIWWRRFGLCVSGIFGFKE